MHLFRGPQTHSPLANLNKHPPFPTFGSNQAALAGTAALAALPASPLRALRTAARYADLRPPTCTQFRVVPLDREQRPTSASCDVRCRAGFSEKSSKGCNFGAAREAALQDLMRNRLIDQDSALAGFESTICGERFLSLVVPIPQRCHSSLQPMCVQRQSGAPLNRSRDVGLHRSS